MAMLCDAALVGFYVDDCMFEVVAVVMVVGLYLLLKTPAVKKSAPQAQAPRPRPPSIEELTSQLQAHVKSRSHALGLDCYRDLRAQMPRGGHPNQSSMCRSAAVCAVRMQNLKFVKWLVKDMQEQGVELDAGFFESTMRLLASKRHFAAALDVYCALLRTAHPISQDSLSCAVGFCVEVSDPFQGAAMLLGGSGLTGAPAGSIRAYMKVLKALSVLKSGQAAQQATVLLKDMQRKEVPVDTLSFNIVLTTLVEAGQPADAAALLAATQASAPQLSDPVSYNIVVRSLATSGQPDQAWAVVAAMEAAGHKAGRASFIPFLACGGEHRWRADRGLKQLDRAAAEGS